MSPAAGLVVPAGTVGARAGEAAVEPTIGAAVGDWQHMVAVDLTGLMCRTSEAVAYLVKAAADGPLKVADVVDIGLVAGRSVVGMAAVWRATK
ncbi:hypothetical protein ACFQ78_36770 [Streptomyces sp. NPDC056519]|uniref:hypothetical protein n=1 Tax=Streptomyces sp. NPDC056519 TaxID=3345849 RepID=UPI00368DBC09